MPSSGRNRNRGERAGLTRERIVREALALADQRGADAFSMRAIAARLGVDATATYYWFASRDELFDAMAQQAVEEVHLGETDPRHPWDQVLADLAEAFWRGLLNHPGVVPHVSTRIPATPNMLQAADRALDALRRAGFGDDEAAGYYQALVNFILGSALTAVARAGLTPDQIQQTRAKAAETIATLDPTPFPQAVALVPQAVQLDPETRFRTGLSLILDGLRTRSQATRNQWHPPRPPDDRCV